MKKITLLITTLLIALFSWQSNAQLSFNDTCTTAFDDISTTGTALTLLDDGEENISIPFAFTLDGVSSSDLRVGNNGGVLFDNTIDEVTLGSNPTIVGFYPFADDIDADYGTVVWETLGTAPNRRVVILWNDRPHFSNSPSGGTFELILHETTNEITFLYQDLDFGMPTVDNGISAGVHVIGANGTYTYSVDTDISNISCVNWYIPTCFPASDLAVSNVTTTGTDLAWTDNNSLTATDYEYVVQLQGTGTPTTAGTATTTNPQPITGLVASTQYEAYLRANCGGSDFSQWVKLDFSSACDPFGDITENFDTTADGELPFCWSKIINSTDTGAVVEVDNFESNSAPNNLRLSNSDDDQAELFLITPQLTDLPNDTHRIRFMAIGGTEYALRIGTITDPTDATTFTPVQVVDVADGYAEYTVEFTGTTTDTYVAIKHDLGGVNRTIRIDDFFWEVIPNCIKPSHIIISGLTSTDVTLTWTENNGTPATEWEYVVQTAGTGEPTTGTSTLVNSITDTTLTETTDYEVFVRAKCSATDFSIWQGPVNFTTPCNAITPDYTENFTTFTPTCWNEADSGDATTGPADLGSGSWGTSTGFANVGTDAGVKINLYDIIKSDWILSPSFDLSAGGYEIVLDVAVTGWNNSNAATMGSDDEVQLLYTEDLGATWVNLKTWAAGSEPATTGETFSMDLTSTASNVQFAILGSDGTIDDTEDYDFHIDNFKVRIPPSCYEPSDLTVASITITDATFSWTESTDNTTPATTWDLYIVPTGDTAPDTTSTPTIDDATDATATVWSAGTANTTYDVYVRADCGSDNTAVSTWAGPVSFTTLCTPFTAPYIESFENAGAIPDCWEMSGGEDWKFSDTAVGNHIGDNGTLTGNTTSDNYFAWVDSSLDPVAVAPLLTSPMVDVSSLTTPALYFYINSDKETAANSTLNVEVYDGATWNAVGTYNEDTAGWEEKMIVLDDLTITGNVRVRFEFIDTAGGVNFTDDIAIDDVSFREAPTCFIPTDLTVTNIDATAGTADLGWADANTTAPANGWEYEIVDITAAGTPTGTGVATTTNPINVSSLVDGNQYEFLVRAMCTTGDESQWSTSFAWTQEAAPSCAANLVAANVDDSCGNYGMTLTWDADPIATGYKLTVGTTTGGNNVMDAEDVGMVTTYDVTTNFNTEYFYTLVPFNGTGDATGCAEVSFTTATDGCYCISIPTSNDNNGISNVQIGTVDVPNGNVTYFDHTATAVEIRQVASTNVQITFETAYTYATHIWIDLNEDFVFDNSEIVFTGESLADNPTVLDASFILPTGTTVGDQYRMRIGTADTGQATPDSCYSGSYGVTLDFMATIIEETASVNNLTSVGFNYYPNPVTNELTMTANENITSINIFNLLGQNVMTLTPSTLETKVNMSNLATGTYFVKAEVGETVGTFKIIKK